jgi:hypothetical protein
MDPLPLVGRKDQDSRGCDLFSPQEVVRSHIQVKGHFFDSNRRKCRGPELDVQREAGFGVDPADLPHFSERDVHSVIIDS